MHTHLDLWFADRRAAELQRAASLERIATLARADRRARRAWSPASLLVAADRSTLRA
jgi:hypothetical protein